MYSFSDFSTVKDLPDVMTVSQLSAAIGLSLTQTYRYIEKVKIPYVQISKRKIIFKEHLGLVFKGKAPAIHFVICHPKLQGTIEKLYPPRNGNLNH